MNHSADAQQEFIQKGAEKKTTGRLFTPELIAILFVNSMAFFAGYLLIPVLPLFMDSQGISAQIIGVLTSVMMVGIAISEIFWGWVIDRVDLRVAIFFGTVLLGISIALFNFANSLPILAIVLLFYGICRSPLFVVGRWFMSVNAPPDKKAFAMALIGTVSGLIQSVGGFASGYLAEFRGFTFSFSLAAGIALFAGVVILIAGRWLNFKRHEQAEGETAEKSLRKRTVSRETKMITLSLGIIGILYFISMGIYMTYFPLYAAKTNISTSQIGTLFGVRGLVSTLILIPIGRLSDRYNKRIILTVGMVIVGVSMALVPFSGGYTGLLLISLLYALGSAIYFPAITALLSQSIPVFWTGTAMGIFGFMEDIGWLLGPVIGGLLWERINPETPFYFACIVALLVVPIGALLKNRLDHPIVLEEATPA